MCVVWRLAQLWFTAYLNRTFLFDLKNLVVTPWGKPTKNSNAGKTEAPKESCHECAAAQTPASRTRTVLSLQELLTACGVFGCAGRGSRVKRCPAWAQVCPGDPCSVLFAGVVPRAQRRGWRRDRHAGSCARRAGRQPVRGAACCARCARVSPTQTSFPRGFVGSPAPYRELLPALWRVSVKTRACTERARCESVRSVQQACSLVPSEGRLIRPASEGRLSSI